MKHLIVLLLTTVVLISCEKDQQASTPTYHEIEAPETPVAEYPFMDATLQATYRSNLEDQGLLGEVTVFKSLAHASFRSPSGAFEQCDKVSVEGQDLEQANGTYSYEQVNETGIDYGSSVSWSIQGKDRIPNINYTVDHKVPEIGNISVKDSLNLSNDLRLGIDIDSPFTQLGKVDSLVMVIKGQQGEMKVSQSYKEPTIFASATDLSGLGSGPAYIQVSAFSVNTATFNGDYKVAFVNKGVFTRKITLY